MQTATYGKLIVGFLKRAKGRRPVIHEFNRIPTRHLCQIRQERLKSRSENYVIFHNDRKRFRCCGYHFQRLDMAEITTNFCGQYSFTMPTTKACIIEIRQFFRGQKFSLNSFHAPQIDRKRIRIGLQPVPAIP